MKDCKNKGKWSEKKYMKLEEKIEKAKVNNYNIRDCIWLCWGN